MRISRSFQLGEAGFAHCDHVVSRVAGREKSLAGLSDDAVLGRLTVFGGEQSTRMTLAELQMWREIGDAEGVARIAAAVRARLFDVAAFMKELKLRVTLWCNRRHKRRGTLWQGLCKCALVGEGEGLRAVAAYIDLNPLRAGLVADPFAYRRSGYGYEGTQPLKNAKGPVPYDMPPSGTGSI